MVINPLLPLEEMAAPLEPAQQLYVVGHPVDHSLSPAMFRSASSRFHLNWFYNLKECETPEAAQDFLKNGDYLGVNITTPYKPLALELAWEADAAACLAHGANVLVRTANTPAHTANGLVQAEGADLPPESASSAGASLRAYNVDGAGFVVGMNNTGLNLVGEKIALCGTGPTALSILHALAELCEGSGPAQVTLISREEARAEAVLSRYLVERAELGLDEPMLPLASVSYGSDAGCQALAGADIIINATRLGLQPDDPAPFPGELLNSHQAVVDAVYGRGETQLQRNAQAAGAFYMGGFPMLVGQAVSSLKIFAAAAGRELAESDNDLYRAMQAIPEAARTL